MILRSVQFLKGCWGTLAAGLVLMLLGSACSLGLPLVIGSLFEPEAAWPAGIVLLLVLLICSALCSGVKSSCLGRLSNRIATRIRTAMMQKLLVLPKSYFDRHSSGELLSRIGNDVNRFRDALSAGLVYVLEIALSLGAAVAVMVTLQPLLTAILLGSSLLILGVNTLVTRKTAAAAGLAQQKLAQINTLASQGILGIQTLWAFELQHEALGRFHRANRDWESSEGRIIRTRSAVTVLTGILNSLQMVLLLGVGLILIRRQAITPGRLLSFILYAQSIAGPISSASSLLVDVRAALGSMARVWEVLDEEEAPHGHLVPENALRGDIQMENVCFSYPDSPPVLSGLSLRIPAGKVTALVGRSGCGKTTLLNLAAGFLQPQRGQVTLDGLPVCDLSPAWLRAGFSIVTQNPYLFELSIFDNIAAGNPEATGEQVVEAARQAGADAFIRALPQGYATILGENGMTLSGGQRQRLSIARAFLRQAPVLLMDEATSALDTATERAVQQAIDRLARGKTVLLIAHRLSTIRQADKICFLSNGTITAEGTHEELLKCCSGYYDLCREQFPPER